MKLTFDFDVVFHLADCLPQLLVVLLAVVMMMFPYLYFFRRPQYARLEQFPFNFSNLNRATQSNSDFLANYYIIRIAADFCFTTEEAYGGKTDSLLIVSRI